MSTNLPNQNQNQNQNLISPCCSYCVSRDTFNQKKSIEFLLVSLGFGVFQIRAVCEEHKISRPWETISIGRPIKIIKPNFELVEDLN